LWVKKKCDLRRLVQNCTFFVQLSCMVFFQYFLKFLKKFLVFQWLKKSANLFSLKIKSLEKKKCVYKYITFFQKIFLKKTAFTKKIQFCTSRRKSHFFFDSQILQNYKTFDSPCTNSIKKCINTSANCECTNNSF